MPHWVYLLKREYDFNPAKIFVTARVTAVWWRVDAEGVCFRPAQHRDGILAASQAASALCLNLHCSLLDLVSVGLHQNVFRKSPMHPTVAGAPIPAVLSQ